MKKIELKLFSKVFSSTWTAFLLWLIALCLLSSLGLWQLRRAQEKKIFLHQQLLKENSPAVNLNRTLDPQLQQLEYRRMSVNGHYDATHQILIDNQMLQGRAGYFVLTPFFPEGQHTAVLINRGWVEMNKDRSILPEISIRQVYTRIYGKVNHFPVVGLQLSGADEPTSGWPTVVQIINTEKLQQKLGFPVLDFLIELEPAAADGYTREWTRSVTVSSEKHVAYAVQWFALALTLTVLYCWRSLR